MSIKFSNIKAIAFDLDGTLIDSVPDLAVATQNVLQDLNLGTCTEAQVRSWVGNGAKKLIERAISQDGKHIVEPSQLADAMPLFMKHYKESLHHNSRLYSGVKQSVIALYNEGYRLAIVTNKPFQFAEPLIAAFGLADYFELVLGGDSLAKMKPDPLPLQHILDQWQLTAEKLLMVGDSKNDILAAKSAEVASIGLTYGYNYGEDINFYGPDAVCEQFNEIPALLNVRL